MNVQAGDTVLVLKPSYRNGAASTLTEHTVLKVARKYFYVQVESWGEPTAFEIGNGAQRLGAYDVAAYQCRAFTPDAYADFVRRGEAEAIVWELRKRYSYDFLTTDQLVRIAAIIEETP